MSYDFTGNFDKLQDKLTKKGITIDQLDIRDYAGLTENELNYIIDHAEYYIKKSAEDKMKIIYNFKDLKRPDGCTDDNFLKIIETTEFYKEFDACEWVYHGSSGYIQIWEELQKINIDEYIDLFNHIIAEFNTRTSTLVISGLGKFDEKGYELGVKYQVFAGIARAYISKTYMDNNIFTDILYEEYLKRYA